jgi:starvation-inducible DNA-binding protein
MAQASKKASSIEKIEKEISQTNHPQNPVVESLQTQLANSFVVYLNYKHYHWQTFGPLFRDMHRLFDELAAEVYETIDEFAERIRMIGQNPLSRLEELIANSTVKSAAKNTDMREMIKEAQGNAVMIIKHMRGAIKMCEDADDPGTADVFTRHLQIYEKHEWFLRDILETQDGLTS